MLVQDQLSLWESYQSSMQKVRSMNVMITSWIDKVSNRIRLDHVLSDNCVVVHYISRSWLR